MGELDAAWEALTDDLADLHDSKGLADTIIIERHRPLIEAAIRSEGAAVAESLDPERLALAFYNVTRGRWNAIQNTTLQPLPDRADLPDDTRAKSIADGVEVLAEYARLSALQVSE